MVRAARGRLRPYADLGQSGNRLGRPPAVGTSLQEHGVRPAWSLLPHGLVCRPDPGRLLGPTAGAARTRGGPESSPNACCLEARAGAHLLGSVLGGAPQPCPSSLGPFTRAVRAPRRGPHPARSPGDSHGGGEVLAGLPGAVSPAVAHVREALPLPNGLSGKPGEAVSGFSKFLSGIYS